LNQSPMVFQLMLQPNFSCIRAFTSSMGKIVFSG
jgi:hypothetical protein